jgi:hypothetical protein
MQIQQLGPKAKHKKPIMAPDDERFAYTARRTPCAVGAWEAETAPRSFGAVDHDPGRFAATCHMCRYAALLFRAVAQATRQLILARRTYA